MRSCLPSLILSLAAAATAFADSAKPIGIVDIDADRNVTSVQVNASTPELGSLARLAFGAHGAYLTELLTGLPITAVSADVRSCVAGRQLEDDGAVLFRLANGAQGVLWASQVCVGETGGVKIRIFGDKGGLLWELDNPNTLTIHALNGSSEVLRSGGPVTPLTATPPAGRTECFCEALAYIYNQFADGVLAFDGKRVATPIYPSLPEGIRVVSFVDAVIRNTRPENTEKWTKLVV